MTVKKLSKKGSARAHQASDGVLDELLDLLSQLVPVVEHIKVTIEESTMKMPKASSQLDSVTKATESATVEILDVLDSMTQRMGAAAAGLATLKDLRTRKKGGGADEADESAIDAAIGEIERQIGATRTDAMNISVALQVQDITAQQIVGVAHEIDSVRTQLMQILSHFRPDGAPGLAKKITAAAKAVAPPAGSHFDVDARYTKSTERQESADEIVEQWNKRNHE